MSSEEAKQADAKEHIPEGFDSVTAYQADMESASDNEESKDYDSRRAFQADYSSHSDQEMMDVDKKGGRQDLKRRRSRMHNEDQLSQEDILKKMKKRRMKDKEERLKRISNVALNPDWFHSTSEESSSSSYHGSLYSEGPIEMDSHQVRKRAKTMVRPHEKMKMTKQVTRAQTQILEEISDEFYYQCNSIFNEWCQGYDFESEDQEWTKEFVGKIKNCTDILSSEDKKEVWNLIAIPPFVRFVSDPNTKNNFIIRLINELNKKNVGRARRDINAFISIKERQLKEILMYGCIMLIKKSNEEFDLNSAVDLYCFLVKSDHKESIKISMK
jgi:hypothetical protein